MNPIDTPPRPVDLANESVAGEEDPGALDDDAAAEMKAGAGYADHRAATGAPGTPGAPSAPASPPPLAPGDEAAPGTPGTGEGICPRCGGSGRVDAGTCPECEGTGKVTVGIGGA